MNDERYQTIEQSIIRACQDVKKMRAGELPKPSLEDLWAEFEKEIVDKSADKKKIGVAL